MKDELYLSALQNYLSGSEWRESVEVFIRAHCLYFENIREYHAQQHVLWRAFQEVAENILQVALSLVGGSIEELEEAIEAVQRRPSRGPRDEVVKEVLRSLQCVDDFDHFAQVMHEHCVEALSEQSSSGSSGGVHNRWDALMRMGFSVQSIAQAHERLGGDHCALEEVVALLSARAQEKEEERESERERLAQRRRQQHSSQAHKYTHNTNSTHTHTHTHTHGQTHNRAHAHKPAPYDDSLVSLVAAVKATPCANESETHAPHQNSYSYFEQKEQDERQRERQRDREAERGKKRKQTSSSHTHTDAALAPLLKFAEEFAAESDYQEEINVSELQAKFTTADGVLESCQEILREFSSPAHSASTQHTTDDEMLELAQWAAEMKLFQSDLSEAHTLSLHSRDLCFNHAQGLIVWYRELEAQRQAINARSAGIAGDLLSDGEMRRMAELDRIVAERGTETEKRLHSLLSRHEAVRVEIQRFYRKISIAIAAQGAQKMPRSLVEEMYLFVKEHVAVSGENERDRPTLEELFAAHYLHENDPPSPSHTQAHAALQRMLSVPGAVEIMYSFIELNSLEEEQVMLKREINALLGVVTQEDDAGSVGMRDNPFAGNNNINSNNNALAGASEATSVVDEIFAHALDSRDDKETDIHTTGDSDAKSGGGALIAEDKKGESVLLAEAKDSLSLSLIAEEKTSLDNTHSAADAKDGSAHTPLTSHSTQNPKNANSSNEDAFIDSLKRSHREAMDRLKQALENERLQKLHDLENRLLVRKRKLQQRLNAQEREGDRERDGNMLSVEEERGVIQLLEEELRAVDEQCVSQRQCLLEGVKAHCVQELKRARALTEREALTQSSAQRALSSAAKQEEINADAAQMLREQYEREKNKLLAFYDQEKERQRAKLRKNLEKKRAAANKNKGEAKESKEDDADREAEIEREMEREFAAVEEKIEREMLKSLSPLREQLLLRLGGVSLVQEISRDAQSQQQQSQQRGYLDEYEDDENPRSAHANTLRHVGTLEAMKRMYTEAGEKLQRDLLAKRERQKRDFHTRRAKKSDGSEQQRQEEDQEEKEREREEVADLVRVVDKMLLTAYDTHVLDLCAGLRETHEDDEFSSAVNPSNTVIPAIPVAQQTKEMETRMKAGLLEAFEQAKLDLQNVFEYKQKTGRGRLAERRRKRQEAMRSEGKEREEEGEEQGESEMDDNAALLSEALLEDVMNSFLDPPESPRAASVTVNAVANANLSASRTTQAVSPRAALTQREKTNALEDEKAKILSAHSEKEKALVDDLYTSMMEKKKKLEERIKRKRDKQQASQSINAESKAEDEVEQEQDKLRAWEEAFKKVAASLQHLDPSSLSNISAEQLVGMMERLATGAVDSGIASNDVSRSVSAQNSRPVSAHTTHLAHTAPQADKAIIAREAARISTAYQEEQQKHDLMMKIQQARQRQALQKKLWERNQARALLQQQQQQQAQKQRHSHGLSLSLDEEENEDEEEEDDDEEEEQNTGITIGQYKSRLSELQPFRQPVVRGLGNAPLSPLNDTRTGSAMTQQKSMQLRGLNLSPMQFRR